MQSRGVQGADLYDVRLPSVTRVWLFHGAERRTKTWNACTEQSTINSVAAIKILYRAIATNRDIFEITKPKFKDKLQSIKLLYE